MDNRVMSTTISKLILDITEELNNYIEERQRLSQNKYDYFDGEADGVKQALDIISDIATRD